MCLFVCLRVCVCVCMCALIHVDAHAPWVVTAEIDGDSSVGDRGTVP